MRFATAAGTLSLMFGTAAVGPADRAEACVSGAPVVVSLTGFASSRGRAAVALFDSEDDHARRRDPVRDAFLPIEDGTAQWRIEDLPCGTYSLLAYHDENGNGRLDTRAFGIPAEPYGASNDARSSFGPPAFSDARFELHSGGTRIEVRLR